MKPETSAFVRLVGQVQTAHGIRDYSEAWNMAARLYPVEHAAMRSAGRTEQQVDLANEAAGIRTPAPARPRGGKTTAEVQEAVSKCMRERKCTYDQAWGIVSRQSDFANSMVPSIGLTGKAAVDAQREANLKSVSKGTTPAGVPGDEIVRLALPNDATEEEWNACKNAPTVQDRFDALVAFTKKKSGLEGAAAEAYAWGRYSKIVALGVKATAIKINSSQGTSYAV